MKTAKLTTKTVSLILSAVFLLSCLAPLACGAQYEGSASLYEGGRFLSQAQPQAVDTGVDWDGVYNRILGAVYNPETPVDANGRIKISLRDFGIPFTEDDINYLMNILAFRPALFVCNGVRITYSTTGDGKISYLLFVSDPVNNAKLYGECADVIEKLLCGIKGNDSLSDVDKLLLAHDRLIENCEYDNKGYLSGSVSSESFSPHGALVTKTAVCTGYSMAYKWLCEVLGINCEIITSDTIDHAFNRVEVGGKKYYVDTAWDDPVWDVPGRIYHNHFLESRSKFISSHSGITDLPADATGNEYDNYFSENVTNGIFFIDGYFYYIKPGAPGTRTCQLTKRSLGGVESTVLTLESKYDVDSGSFYTVYDYFPRITAIGSDIIYLAKTTVRAFNTKTGEDRLAYTPKAALFPDSSFLLHGIKQVDGTVYVTSNNSALFDADTVDNYTDSFTLCSHTYKEVVTEINGSVAEICRGCGFLSHTVTVNESCGESLSWSYNEGKKELTVSGTGDMYDFETSQAPWSGLAGEISRVIIEDGVTSIGAGAFESLNLDAVELPGTLTSIGENAFADSAVAHLYYTGSSEDYSSKVNVESGNDALTQAAKHFEEEAPCPHVYEEVTVTEPTCTAPGLKEERCIYCKEKGPNETVIRPLGHKFTNYVYNNDATTESDGTETAKCDRCDVTDTRKKAGSKLMPQVAIAGYRSSVNLSYGGTINLRAQVANAPAGATVVWFKDGGRAGEGETFSVANAGGSFTVQAKLMKDGAVLSESGVETVNVNNSFFARLIAFFKKLFGGAEVINQ